jgi:hypothetical protein
MAISCSDVIDSLAQHLARAGYVIYNGNADTGDTVDEESGVDWWFTWTNGGDIEVGPTADSMLAATGEAMAHWFEASTISH